MEKVILVDEYDHMIGVSEKLEAHEKGLLHRAFSVFIFNKRGELLLQKRALHKYHSPGLWTNTCCSHPRPDEATLNAAERRCQEEMGIQVVLKEAFSFIYKASFENGLTEHEYDHVYIGQYEHDPVINTEEVETFQWMSPKDIQKELSEHPEHYTAWFKLCFEKVIDHYSQKS